MAVLTTRDELKRAQARAIDGPHREYALEVRRLLGYFPEDRRPYLSLRQAEGKTGVKHTTVGTMARGFRADAYNTRMFAEKLGGDANRLLELGEHSVDSNSQFSNKPLSRIGPDTDILSLIGPDVNTGPLADSPLAPYPAHAGECGGSLDFSEDVETVGDRLPTDVRSIEVVGDCMLPLYQPGDILHVRETSQASDWDEVIALVDDDTVSCKVYHSYDGGFLEPYNGEGRIPMHRFKIRGVVEGFTRLKRR